MGKAERRRRRVYFLAEIWFQHPSENAHIIDEM